VGSFLGVQLVLPSGPSAADDATRTLTVRETEVLRLVAEGLNDTEIADRLYLSPHTVHRHMANIRARLGYSSRAAAAAHAARLSLI
jgi:DNA-binding NarL/FixJ family response regulator